MKRRVNVENHRNVVRRIGNNVLDIFYYTCIAVLVYGARLFDLCSAVEEEIVKIKRMTGSKRLSCFFNVIVNILLINRIESES